MQIDLNDGKFYTKNLIKLLGNPRKDNEKLNSRHYEIAYALQIHFEKIMIFILNYLYKITQTKNVVLAGGCIMNCKFNGKIIEELVSEMYTYPLLQMTLVFQLGQLI